jgi:hypothetical protein
MVIAEGKKRKWGSRKKVDRTKSLKILICFHCSSQSKKFDTLGMWRQDWLLLNLS